MNSKLHAVTDANARPLSFFMTAGQVSDYTDAAALLDDAQGKVAARHGQDRSGRTAGLSAHMPEPVAGEDRYGRKML